MRQYTTIEAIATLKDNPNLVYKTIACNGDIINMFCSEIKYDLHKIMWSGHTTNPEPIPLTSVVLNYRWTLAQFSVTWQEALQAWAKGKTIKCIIPSETESVSCSNKTFIYDANSLRAKDGHIFNCDDILNGTWYIKNE